MHTHTTKGVKMKPDFYDIRTVKVTASSIILDNQEIKETANNFITGASIRALINGSWGIATTENPEHTGKALSTATEIALSTNRKTPREKVELAIVNQPEIKNLPAVKEDFKDIDLEEKLKLVKEIAKAAQKPGITSVSTSYMESEVTVEYVNSEGIEASYTLPRIGFTVAAVAKQNGNYQIARDSRFAISGFELFAKHDACKIASKTADIAIDLIRAKSVKGGVMPVILDTELAGVFIHEAVGHAAEADHVLEGNSVLEDRLHTQIASPLVTVCDDSSMHEYGYYPFDDEGSQSGKTVLIENGVLKSYLHNRESASKFGGTPHNARAQGYSMPIIRMSNTYVENGSTTFEEMKDEIKNGIYLIGSRGGQVNPGDGIFQFSAERGYMIENGELTTLLKDVSLSGSILEILKNVAAVGCDLKMRSGQCGKAGQFVPVSDGSPHVLVTNTLVGGTGC